MGNWRLTATLNNSADMVQMHKAK